MMLLTASVFAADMGLNKDGSFYWNDYTVEPAFTASTKSGKDSVYFYEVEYPLVALLRDVLNDKDWNLRGVGSFSDTVEAEIMLPVFSGRYFAVVGNDNFLWIYTNHYGKENQRLGVFQTTITK